MKLRYHDVIEDKYINVEVSAKIKHFIKKNKKEEKEQEENNRDVLSLDKLLEKGFQPIYGRSIEEELEIREREERYLRSREYQLFRKNLKKAIAMRMDKMSKKIRTVMYLRFFKNYSISKIAEELYVSKGTAQDYIARGVGYIRKFLERDIERQDKIEERRRKNKSKNF